jgi:hypothetical protein
MTLPIPNPNELPPELVALNQWICWKEEERNGKLTKIPVAPWKTGDLRPVAANDSSCWTSLTTALDYARRLGIGVGFCFRKGGGIVGIDLDKCVDESGRISRSAANIIREANSYTELSPSGRGVHVFVKGELPDNIVADEVEAYDHDRYFTVTGRRCIQTPRALNEAPELLDKLWRKYGKEPHVQSRTSKIDIMKVAEDYGILAKLKKRGVQFQGPHPVHGSDNTGMNFSIRPDKNCWFCYRHWIGGGPLELIAMLEGIVKCEDFLRGGLKGAAFDRAVEIAQEKGYIQEASKREGAFERAMEILSSMLDRVFIEASCAEPFATLKVAEDGSSHLANLPLRSRQFEAFLNALYYTKEGKGLREEVRRDIISTLEGRAFAEQTTDRLELLGWVDEAGKRILVDLGNPAWNAIEITPHGWSITAPVPNPFRRTELTTKLPKPSPPEDPLQILLSIVPKNLAGEGAEDVKKVLPVWIATVPLTHIARPMLVFHGPHGSGKTTATRRICRVFSSLDVQALDGVDVRDTIVKLWSSPIVGFDNVREIGPDVASLLSMAITGGQYVSRELYTDREVQVVAVKRAICLNGITTNVTAYPDLTDRSIFVELRRLEEGERREEAALMREFEALRPRILGAIVEALSRGLAHLDRVRQELGGKPLPRMADWAVWGEAIARGLGMRPYEFLNAYLRLCEEATLTVLEEDPVGKGLLLLAEKLKEAPEVDAEPAEATLPFEAKNRWVGTASQLLSKLREVMPDEAGELPDRPQVLGRRLKNLIPNLLDKGVHLEFRRIGKAASRVVEIRVVDREEIMGVLEDSLIKGNSNPQKVTATDELWGGEGGNTEEAPSLSSPSSYLPTVSEIPEKGFENSSFVKTPQAQKTQTGAQIPIVPHPQGSGKESEKEGRGLGGDTPRISAPVAPVAPVGGFVKTPPEVYPSKVTTITNIARALQLLHPNGWTELELLAEVERAGIERQAGAYWLQKAIEEGEAFEVSTGVYLLIRRPNPSLERAVRLREDLPDLVVGVSDGSPVTVQAKRGQLIALPAPVANRLVGAGKAEEVEKTLEDYL